MCSYHGTFLSLCGHSLCWAQKIFLKWLTTSVYMAIFCCLNENLSEWKQNTYAYNEACISMII